jgi:hypothetical protein
MEDGEAAAIRVRVSLAVVEGGPILLVPMHGTDAGPLQ